ncbi:hypothetical protein OUZ56_005183 [Daphnia magna]|uniref:Uncharacterized protein n=1 Tax=Daphnia magna TaxID=35525 RepID=A0ABQ9YS28_9CRUS|nr:hypothetical protein OUZ56_005183 [Daphnia magna]
MEPPFLKCPFPIWNKLGGGPVVVEELCEQSPFTSIYICKGFALIFDREKRRPSTTGQGNFKRIKEADAVRVRKGWKESQEIKTERDFRQSPRVYSVVTTTVEENECVRWCRCRRLNYEAASLSLDDGDMAMPAMRPDD